ncbi:Alpha/beta hydrolase fold [Parasponia andersonii]|uniref:Alpha/beta hydrolase fold n=1 Tax=Parasponia andersonii TaxID=3476 RepID=A0A2P5ASR9_PARAD|nr:Alpha/beta hydrolase fold [Parasponia andersonii]
MDEHDASKAEIAAYELLPLLRLYKDGRVEGLLGNDFVPPSTNPQNGVVSKDITLVPEFNITARIYLPPIPDPNPNPKLPLVVYFHVSGFCVASPFTSKCQHYLNTLVAHARVVSVSWIISHHDRNGPEAWLNDHADFERVFLAGESAGANIARNMALKAGQPEFGLSVGLLGVALVHPYFWGSVPIGSEALAGIGCGMVLVCVAERDRGRLYCEALSGSGCTRVVEIDETKDEDHVFDLYDLDGQNARDLIRQLASFFNGG